MEGATTAIEVVIQCISIDLHVITSLLLFILYLIVQISQFVSSSLIEVFQAGRGKGNVVTNKTQRHL